MKLKDILFAVAVIWALTFIDFDKEALKALVTGAVTSYYLTRRMYK